MIEKTIFDYLKTDFNVFMEETEQMPKRYLVIHRAGGFEENHIKHATIVVRSYAESKLEAAKLNEQLKDKMRNIIELNKISKCSLNSDYDNTDTARKKYRYQAVFNLVYFD